MISEARPSPPPGDSLGFYFSFLRFYSRWVQAVCCAGLVVYASDRWRGRPAPAASASPSLSDAEYWNSIEGDLPSRLSLGFALGLALWGALLVEAWGRHEQREALRCGVIELEARAPPRARDAGSQSLVRAALGSPALAG